MAEVISDEYVLVIDFGTSAVKSVIFDMDGQELASVSLTCVFAVENDQGPLSRRYEPEATWRTCCESIRLVIAESGVDAKSIVALSATGQRQGVAFLDSEGREVYLGPNTDLRAVFQGAAIDEEHRDLVYSTTGHLPSFLMASSKLLWFHEFREREFERIRSVVSIVDWLAFRLTDILTTEATLAAESGLLDISTGEFPNGLYHSLGLSNYSSNVAFAGAVIGEFSKLAAGATGLAMGTPVIAAGADSQCGLLGMGVTELNQIGIVAGWSTAIQMVMPSFTPSTTMNTWHSRHLIPDRYVIESSPGDQGNSYAWLASMAYEASADAYFQMNSDAASAAVGAEFTRSYWGPVKADASRVGMKMGGMLFPTPMTFGNIGKAELVRSALESFCFSIRANIEQIESVTGRSAGSIALGGGMTRSRAFSRILADVLDRPINLSNSPSVSAKGAYLCAMVGIGRSVGLLESSRQASTSLERIVPDVRSASEYQDIYEQWIEIAETLNDIQL